MGRVGPASIDEKCQHHWHFEILQRIELDGPPLILLVGSCDIVPKECFISLAFFDERKCVTIQ